jgi:predicted YcjX-like family ATPase
LFKSSDRKNAKGKKTGGDNSHELSFVRFRPPQLETNDNHIAINLPHIRLDKALQFLLADRLI